MLHILCSLVETVLHSQTNLLVWVGGVRLSNNCGGMLLQDVLGRLCIAEECGSLGVAHLVDTAFDAVRLRLLQGAHLLFHKGTKRAAVLAILRCFEFIAERLQGFLVKEVFSYIGLA